MFYDLVPFPDSRHLRMGMCKLVESSSSACDEIHYDIGHSYVIMMSL